MTGVRCHLGGGCHLARRCAPSSDNPDPQRWGYHVWSQATPGIRVAMLTHPALCRCARGGKRREVMAPLQNGARARITPVHRSRIRPEWSLSSDHRRGSPRSADRVNRHSCMGEHNDLKPQLGGRDHLSKPASCCLIRSMALWSLTLPFVIEFQRLAQMPPQRRRRANVVWSLI